MRFKIGEKTYETAAIDEVSLKDLMRFNREAAEFGVTWADVERLGAEVNGLTEAEAEEHPQKLLLVAVTVWVARRASGEDVSFGDAIDVPMSQIQIIPEPADHKPGKARKSARKVSVPADDAATDAE